MGNGDEKDGARRPYTAPTVQRLDAHEVVRRLLDALATPLGDTRDDRIRNTAATINGLLERLPFDERRETIQRVVAVGVNWNRKF